MKKNNINTLKKGGVGVAMTDTLYGILGSALNSDTVERIYQIKGRDLKKPFIILISLEKDLEFFGIKLDKETEKALKKYWPGKNSIVLPCRDKKFYYLHRGKNSLAFRLPRNKKLISVLKQTGPLVAPSANPEGKEPANSIKRAQKYFAGKIDFYEAGRGGSKNPSRIVKIDEGKVSILRK